MLVKDPRATRFTSICYKHMLNMAYADILCWATDIKHILFSTGFW